MNGASAVARILKQEGVESLSCFPANPIIEEAAKLGIRPIICRQERAGVNIADGYSRAKFGDQFGVFAMQYGPGAENAFGGVAQAFADSIPILLLPTGYERARSGTHPNFSAAENYAGITKWSARATDAHQIPELMRRAITHLRTGRAGPVLLEIPKDIATEEIQGTIPDYHPVQRVRSAGDPQDIAKVASALLNAERPIIHAGQGILWAQASKELISLAELLGIPVMTTLTGKSSFPENHPLALGTGSNTTTGTVEHFLFRSDVVFGIGCSFSLTTFGVTIPRGKVIIHATNDPLDINKDYQADLAVIGDAKLVLQQLIHEVIHQTGTRAPREHATLVKEIKTVKQTWLKSWMPKLTSPDMPLNPYRVIWDVMNSIDRHNTIITHDSGSPRDQTVPFFEALVPGGYIGWGKSTQLGYGLGLAIGAKLANPHKVVINIMGDTAFGMAGIDIETAARCKLPIITVLLNNSVMGGYRDRMPTATELYGASRLTGDYAKVAEGLGAYSERVTVPDDIIPALRRADEIAASGQPVLLEFVTCEELEVSKFN
jgi:acetolactate synthase-1/2/3 large subunit